MQDTNYPTIQDLPGCNPGHLVDLPANVLSDLQRAALEQLDLAKKAVTVLDSALSAKYADQIKNAHKDKGDDFGTVHFKDGGIGTEATTPKNVSWDQEGLFAVLSSMSEEDAVHYRKLKLEVPESKFNSAPPDIAKKLEPLRTVKPGKVKIRFEQEED